MPQQRKGPRLWLQPPVKDRSGKILEQSVWVIRDGKVNAALAAARAKLSKLKENSGTTSTPSQQNGPATVTRLRSSSQT